MQRWEYKVIEPTTLKKSNMGRLFESWLPSEEEDHLNSLGDEGWELIGVTGYHRGYGGASVRAYLKRPKQK